MHASVLFFNNKIKIIKVFASKQLIVRNMKLKKLEQYLFVWFCRSIRYVTIRH